MAERVLATTLSGDSPQWQRLTPIHQQRKGRRLHDLGRLADRARCQAQRAAGDEPVPLLFGADLEAGAGFRARGGYFIPNAIDLGGAVVFPPEMAIGATGDTTAGLRAGKLTALEGRALGIHIAYAPVLDVNNNPANPVINTRSLR